MNICNKYIYRQKARTARNSPDRSEYNNNNTNNKCI